MRDANLNVREDVLLPLEREHRPWTVALTLLMLLFVLAAGAFLGYSFHILWLHR